MEDHRGHPLKMFSTASPVCLVLLLGRAWSAEEREPDGRSERAERCKARNCEREALLLEGLGFEPCRADVADDLERRSPDHGSIARKELDLHLEDAGDANSPGPDLHEAPESDRLPASGVDEIGRRNLRAVEVHELAAAPYRAGRETAASAHEDGFTAREGGRLAAHGLKVEPPSPLIVVVVRPRGLGKRREGSEP